MKKNLLVVAIVATMSLLFNCGKSDPAPTKIDLITRANGWSITSAKLNGAETITACRGDDVFTFLKNKTFTLSFGSNHCDSNEVTETNSWDIYGTNESLLNVHTANSNVDYTIVELTSTSLKITLTDNNGTQLITFAGK